jgi:hypothetical protein
VLATALRVLDDVTYEGSGADLDGRGSLSNGAVGGGENRVGVQERSSAEVASALLDADDEGEVACRSSGSANNGLIGELALGERRVLGDGCGSADGRDRKSDEDIFDLHLE